MSSCSTVCQLGAFNTATGDTFNYHIYLEENTNVYTFTYTVANIILQLHNSIAGYTVCARLKWHFQFILWSDAAENQTPDWWIKVLFTWAGEDDVKSKWCKNVEMCLPCVGTGLRDSLEITQMTNRSFILITSKTNKATNQKYLIYSLVGLSHHGHFFTGYNLKCNVVLCQCPSVAPSS